MSNKKHFILTSLNLGLIAASSGLLIGGAHLLTEQRIKRNEQNKVVDGLSDIFKKFENVEISKDIKGVPVKAEESLLKEFKYEYVTEYYIVGESLFAFKTTGSNSYGKISLLIGFEAEKFQKVSVIVDEQTFASTLEEGYINPLNGDCIKTDDVSCGATYGAKLVREMINDAGKAAKDLNGKV